MTLSTPQLRWSPTNAARARRHDDIWFIDADTGWAVNSDGKVLKTEDGGASWQRQFHLPGVWLRCVGFSNNLTGWVGTTNAAQRLFRTRDGGQNWTSVSGLPMVAPFVCGLSVVNEKVIYGAGTNEPGKINNGAVANIPGVIKSTDGGESWVGFDLSQHANLLVDIYFPEPDRGWVVGGKAAVPNPTTRGRVKPVVLFTDNGGETWTNLLADHPDLPLGEWGWKVFFVNEQVGYVSLENMVDGAVLKTSDGGRTWARKPINDQQGNANLEGIGFVDEQNGWVGGWGDRLFQGGFSSATGDGAENWRDANEIGRFINRFRFLGDPVSVGYASGDTIYKYSSEPVPELVLAAGSADFLAASEGPDETAPPVEIVFTVPAGAQRLTINVWDRFAVHVARPIDEQNPRSGRRSFAWDFRDDTGASLEPGYYVYRVSIDDDSESRVIRVTS